MIKKIIKILSVILIFLVLSIVYLSFIGIKTEKFNEAIMALGSGGAVGNGIPGGTRPDAVPGTLLVPNGVPIKFYEYVNP